MRVFVYGTLLRGQGNHRLLQRARFAGCASTPPVYRMHSLGGFPGVVRGGSQSIAGELYDVDADTLEDLDRLEGHPRWYKRTVIELADGTSASTYLLSSRHVAGRPVIDSGNWLQHRRELRP